MTTTLKDPIAEIARIDNLLDLCRELLMEAEKLTDEKDRLEKTARQKARINDFLDSRIEWMKKRDAVKEDK